MKNYKQKTLKIFLIKLAIFVCLSALIFASLFFSTSIERFLNGTQFFASTEFVNSSYSVHYIDVGQGDCSFIKVGDKCIMIDAGTKDSAKNITRYLNQLNYFSGDKIDYLILTHTDSDHIGGAEHLLDYFKFENIYRPKVYSSFEVENNLNTQDFNTDTSLLWSNVTQKILVENANIFYSFRGESIIHNDFKINFYSPFKNKIENSNDYSPIIMLEVSGKKFIFMGDASAQIENEFLLEYSQEIYENLFDCDILKVAHHGSKNSSTQAFLNAVKPEFAIVSCGLENSYGHPSNEVINNLENINCNIFRTDTMGSVVAYESDAEICFESGFNFITSIYFEWWVFVVSFEIILVFVLFFKI